MSKIKLWILKKLIGNTPVIMNVTLVLASQIKASAPDGIIENSYITYSEGELQ